MRREAVRLNARLNSDAATMQISIGTNERVMGAVIFSSPELDQLIAALADIRSRMTPEVPQEFPVGKPTHRHDATRYQLGIDPFSQQTLLSFRSPGFGWLTFPIAEGEVERMYNRLREHKTRPATPRSDKMQ